MSPENYKCLPVSSSQTDCGSLRCQAEELGLNPVGSRGPLETLKRGQQNNYMDIQENYLWQQFREIITGDKRAGGEGCRGRGDQSQGGQEEDSTSSNRMG